MSHEVIIRREGRVGRISLNRPKALHALTTAMCEAISSALIDWREDEGIAAILLDHAEGTRGFCAGGDVGQVRRSALEDGGASGRAFFRAEYRMNHLLFTYPKPIVAFMDGVTMGGGVGLALPCRFRIATENTSFAMPEGAIGLFPDVGAGWYLPRLPGATGKFLALTAARLDGAECLWAGLATHYLPGERLNDAKTRIAAALDSHAGAGTKTDWGAAGAAGADIAETGGLNRASTAPTAARSRGPEAAADPADTRSQDLAPEPATALPRAPGAAARSDPAASDPADTAGHDRAFAAPAATLSPAQDQAEAAIAQVLDALSAEPPDPRLADNAGKIDRLFASDRLEEILAALAADPSDWAAKEFRAVSAKCPASAKVALRQFALAAPDFAAEMALEYRLAARMIVRPDFAEGVRAVLVDKDNAPRWDPPAPESVTEAMLDSIFAPLPPEDEWRADPN